MIPTPRTLDGAHLHHTSSPSSPWTETDMRTHLLGALALFATALSAQAQELDGQDTATRLVPSRFEQWKAEKL